MSKHPNPFKSGVEVRTWNGTVHGKDKILEVRPDRKFNLNGHQWSWFKPIGQGTALRCGWGKLFGGIRSVRIE